MEELNQFIEPKRKTVLLKIIMFNNYYAEHLLTFNKYKDKINFSKTHLYWSKDNVLKESKDVGIYGLKEMASLEDILKDKELKPLIISYLAIKAILHNDRRIFEKWGISFNELAEELNNSIMKNELLPEEKIMEFNSILKEIDNEKYSGQKK